MDVSSLYADRRGVGQACHCCEYIPHRDCDWLYIIAQEIPLEPTEPGLPRPYYTGHARTELLVAEAQRAINDVVFSPEPNRNSGVRGIRMLPGSELPPLPQGQIISRPASTQVTGGSVGSSTPDQSVRNSVRYSQSVASPPGTFIGLPEVGENTGSLGFSPYMGPEHVPALSRSPSPGSAMSVVTLSQTNPFASPPMQNRQLSMSNSDVSEFGAYPASGGQFAPRTSSLRNMGGDSQPSSPVAGGPRGKFATFPVKMTGPRAQPGAPPGQQYPSHTLDTRAPSLDIDGSSDDFSASVAQALGHRWSEPGVGAPSTPGTIAPNAQSKKAMEAHEHSGSMDYTSPPPQYSLTVDTPTSPGMLRTTSAGTISTPTVPEEDESDQGDTGLAYMGTTDDDASAAPASDDRRRSSVDRRVKFEGSETEGPTAQGEQSRDLAVPGPSHGDSQEETQSAVGSDAQHDISENSLLHRGPEQQEEGEQERTSESGHQKEETIRASQQLPPVPQEQESQIDAEPVVNNTLPESECPALRSSRLSLTYRSQSHQ